MELTLAGIGVRLNKIYSKNTIATSLFGFGYSTVITIAPMFLVIATAMGMQWMLGFSWRSPKMTAYYTNPYEIEAYANEHNPDYPMIYDPKTLNRYRIKHRSHTYKAHQNDWHRYILEL